MSRFLSIFLVRFSLLPVYINATPVSYTHLFELDEEKKLHNVTVRGGCSGNTQGIAKLVEGMDAQEVIRRLDGIRCGMRPTSCPDQLSKALKEALQ